MYGGARIFYDFARYPPFLLQKVAEQEGCQQCLWLLGSDDEITEVGSMNVFAQIKKPNSSEIELVTPPLTSGCILPGVTRRSIMELTKDWDEFEVNERKITMSEVNHFDPFFLFFLRKNRNIQFIFFRLQLLKARDENRLVEFFGAGTAAIVSPIGNVKYRGKMQPIPTNQTETALSARIKAAMSDIYYGRIEHPWALEIENWGEQSSMEKERLSSYQDSIRVHLKNH